MKSIYFFVGSLFTLNFFADIQVCGNDNCSIEQVKHPLVTENIIPHYIMPTQEEVDQLLQKIVYQLKFNQEKKALLKEYFLCLLKYWLAFLKEEEATKLAQEIRNISSGNLSPIFDSLLIMVSEDKLANFNPEWKEEQYFEPSYEKLQKIATNIAITFDLTEEQEIMLLEKIVQLYDLWKTFIYSSPVKTITEALKELTDNIYVPIFDLRLLMIKTTKLQRILKSRNPMIN